MKSNGVDTGEELLGGRYVVPRQRQFRADLVVVNDCLDQLIGLARQCSEPEDLEALQERDYSKARIPWGRAGGKKSNRHHHIQWVA